MRTTNRPIFLDIISIRLPNTEPPNTRPPRAGVLFLTGLPLLLWLLAGTLDNAAAFESYRAFVAHPLVKIGLIGLLWAYLHHFFAGIRFLFLDAHKGLALNTARTTAKTVMALALICTAILGVWLW